VTTVCDLFRETVARYPERTALRTREGAEFTWREYARRVREVAAGLAALGVTRGDTVALMLANRPEFHIADTAAFHLGAVPFSLYNSSSLEQIEHLLADAAPKVVITEHAFRGAIGRTDGVYVVDGTPSLDELTGAADFDLDAAARVVQPDDLLTLIYTSGTTGPPKGVEITHANYVAELQAFDGLDIVAPGRVVSYFPMAHIAERVISHYNAIAYGHTVTCCPDAREVMSYIAETRPTFFFAVPRIWEKLKAALEAGFDDATREALQIELRKLRAGEPLDATVFAPLRERLGLDAAEHILTGAAPSPVELLEFFHALGIEILEVWGMSELSGLATANSPGGAKLGTVGRAAAGVELRLAGDGEVLVRGGIVTRGYRNHPEQTAAAFDADGWFCTGDIGELDGDGYLRIVDRKKELIVNSAGQNVSPANVEAVVKSSSPLIGQVCVVGDRRPHNVALVVLDPDGARSFAGPDRELAELARDAVVLEEVARAIERANARLSRPEQVKRFHVLEHDWEPAGDELTPTLKLRRRPIERKYAAEIEALYMPSPVGSAS
jgi:long-subunit acyl-CoA synthetase (AMP-forming)